MSIINFDDPNKLHMSIGLVLIAFGFLFAVSNTWTAYERNIEISNKINTYSLELKENNQNHQDLFTLGNKINTTLSELDYNLYFLGFTKKVMLFCFISGGFLFFIGYWRFIKKEWHNI